MKKFLLILAGVSSFALSSANVLAADKILSPVSGWNVEKLKALGSKSACMVYTQYEDGVTLSLEAVQSQLSALRFSVPSVNATVGHSFEITVAITPNYHAVKPAQVVSETEFIIDATNDVELLRAIQHGFIINVNAAGISYGLSLVGASDGVRRLLTCRDTNWRAARRVYDSAHDQIDQATLSPDPALESSAENSPVQINAYPLQPEASGTGEELIIEPAPKKGGKDYIIETETIEITQQSGDVIDLSNADQQQVVIEPVNTVTRVHTPKVKIQPRHQTEGTSAAAIVDVAVPIRTTDDLVKPPEFEEGLLREAQEMASDNPSETPMAVPARNPNARLSSPHENVKRLARQSDTEHEILLEESVVPKRNENAMLSQSPDGIYTRPVVIPRIPEADLPSRIDITNRDMNVAPTTQPSLPARSRTVSNQALENEMKSRDVSNSTYHEKSDVAAIENPMIASEPEAVPAVTPTFAQSQNMRNAPEATFRWNANQGDDLRDILAKWSVEEGVELIWDSEQQYVLLSAIKLNSSYEKVVAHVLNQFMMTPNLAHRPVGQLYVDPQSGNKVLIIQTDQS